MKKYIRKTYQGQMLSEDELKKLTFYLKIRISPIQIIVEAFLFLFILTISLFLYGVFPISKPNILLGVIIDCFCAVVLVILFFKYFLHKDELYLSSIDKFYKNELVEYSNMKHVFTILKKQPGTNFDGESVLFFYDDYYFIVVEDFLKDTIYKYDAKYISEYNPNPTLKIFRKNSQVKHVIKFKLSDIDYYVLHGNVNKEIEHKEIEEYLHSFSINDYNNYVEIHFKDFNSLKFGTDVYTIMKRIIPTKEIKNEEE